MLGKCSVFASSELLHLFFTSNSVVFVDRGCKNISCPGAGYPSYATKADRYQSRCYSQLPCFMFSI